MNKRDREASGSKEDELDLLKEIIRSNPNLHDKVLARMRQLRHEIKQSLNEYVKEKEVVGAMDLLDSKKRNYTK